MWEGTRDTSPECATSHATAAAAAATAAPCCFVHTTQYLTPRMQHCTTESVVFLLLLPLDLGHD